MSQSTPRKRWPALQIALLLSSTLVGCSLGLPLKQSTASPNPKAPPIILTHEQTLRTIEMGSSDPIRRVLLWKDLQELSRPTAIGLRGQTMYIADGDLGVVFRYDLNSRRMEPVRGVGEKLAGDAADIFVAKDSTIYVADPVGKRVLRFTWDGEYISTFEDATNLSRPVGVIVDDQDNVLVADELYSLIVAFNPSGDSVYGMGGRGEGPGKFRFITDFAATKNGFVVGDRVELPVQVLDKKGKYLSHFGERVVEFPTAVAADDSGRVYVFDKADSRIKVFKDGELVEMFGRNGDGDGEFRFVSDMKYADGKLYVADTLNARIQILSVAH